MNIHHSVLENETHNSNEKSGSPTRERPRLDLRRLKWASRLSPETLNAIMNDAEWVDFQPGEVLIDVDAEITHLYFLLTGRVQAILYDALGKEIEKDTIVPGFAIGLIALSSQDQCQLHAEAVEPSRTIRFTVPNLLALAAKHGDFQRVLFQMAVNAFKRYMTADRSLPKPSIVGIVHHSAASRPLAGRLARRLRSLDESPCIAGDDEQWQPDRGIPFKLVFRQGHVGQDDFKGWALDRRLLVDIRADQSPEAMTFLLSHGDIVLWCIRPQDAPAAVTLLRRLEQDVPSWREKIRIVWVLDHNTPIAPYVPELSELAARDFKLTLDAPGANQNSLLHHGIERIVHHLRGIQIGLALGGGAARGMAHLGVLKALEQHGIYIDMLAGTSAGAMTGALYAAGLDPDFIARSFKVDLQPPWFFRKLPGGGYWYLLYKYRRHKFDSMIRKYLKVSKMQQLILPLFTVAVDLIEGGPVVCGVDDAATAVLASINLPPLSLPILESGHAYVDGGLLNNVPADVLVANGCNFVIASTVTAKLEKDFSGSRSRRRSHNGPFPSTIQVIMRQTMIQGYNMNSIGVGPADFVLAPDVTSFDISEFTRVDEMARIGEATTNENIAKLRKMLNRLDPKLFKSPDQENLRERVTA